MNYTATDVEREIRVEILDNAAVEPSETFRLQLSNLNGATGVYLHNDRATATIQSDDTTATPIVTLTATSQVEGDSGQSEVPIVVQLATAVSSPVTLTVATTTKGTADSAADFVPFSQTVTFQPGQTVKEVSLAVKGDKLTKTMKTSPSPRRTTAPSSRR